MIKRLCCMALAVALMLFPHAAAAETPVLSPSGLLALEDGGLIVADLFQRGLWRQDADGSLTRLAGREGVKSLSGVPVGGYVDGTAEKAAFESPWAVAPYLDGYAVTDTENQVLRYVGPKGVSTLAGSGVPGTVNGTGTGAAFNGPTGLAAGPDGSLYVSDTGNHLIRKIDAKGVVTTYAGGGAGRADGSLQEARFREPTGLCYEDGALYVADSGNNRICKIENETVTTHAGSGAEDGFQDGAAASALFSHPQGVTTDGIAVYVADTGNGAVRVIRDGMVSTLIKSGEGGLYPVSPRGIVLQNGQLSVGDIFARVIFTVETEPPKSDPVEEPVAPVAYSDVPTGAWYAEAVAQMSAQGLMGGVGKERFNPTGQLDRAMSVTILSRLETAAHPDTVIRGEYVFQDVVDSAYYANAAAWAADHQLVQGVEGAFLPERAITRAELAALLYRYAGKSGLDLSVGAELTAFEDGASVPKWAESALRWSCGAGILNGKLGNQLAPSDPVTRAEAAVIFQRYLMLST